MDRGLGATAPLWVGSLNEWACCRRGPAFRDEELAGDGDEEDGGGGGGL